VHQALASLSQQKDPFCFFSTLNKEESTIRTALTSMKHQIGTYVSAWLMSAVVRALAPLMTRERSLILAACILTRTDPVAIEASAYPASDAEQEFFIRRAFAVDGITLLNNVDSAVSMNAFLKKPPKGDKERKENADEEGEAKVPAPKATASRKRGPAKSKRVDEPEEAVCEVPVAAEAPVAAPAPAPFVPIAHQEPAEVAPASTAPVEPSDDVRRSKRDRKRPASYYLTENELNQAIEEQETVFDVADEEKGHTDELELEEESEEEEEEEDGGDDEDGFFDLEDEDHVDSSSAHVASAESTAITVTGKKRQRRQGTSGAKPRKHSKNHLYGPEGYLLTSVLTAKERSLRPFISRYEAQQKYVVNYQAKLEKFNRMPYVRFLSLKRSAGALSLAARPSMHDASHRAVMLDFGYYLNMLFPFPSPLRPVPMRGVLIPTSCLFEMIGKYMLSAMKPILQEFDTVQVDYTVFETFKMKKGEYITCEPSDEIYERKAHNALTEKATDFYEEDGLENEFTEEEGEDDDFE
jgi:hypothetical protein